MAEPTTQSAPRAKRRWWTFVRVGFSFGLLGYLIYYIQKQPNGGLGKCLELLLDANPRWLAAMVGLMAFGRFLNGMRWYLLLKGVEPNVRYREVMRIFFMSSFLGQFMPGVVGMEAIRVVALGRSISNTALAFASVLVDRILGFFSLVTVVLLSVWLNPVASLPIGVRYAAMIGMACLVGGSLALASPHMRLVVDYMMPGPIRRRISPKLHKIYGCIDAYRKVPLRVIFVLMLSMMAQGQMALESFTMSRALGMSVGFEYFILFVPVIFFTLMLPITVSGLGVREGGYVYTFCTLTQQMTQEQAFTLSLMMMFVVRLASLPGVYFVATSRKKVSETMHQAEALADHPPPTPPETPMAPLAPTAPLKPQA